MGEVRGAVSIADFRPPPQNVSPCVLVFASAAHHKDAGTFNVFLTSDVSCGYGSGWGDVNVLVNLHAFCTLR